MVTRKRLYDDEAKLLGIKPKKHDPGRQTARYYLNVSELEKLEESRKYKKIKRLFYDIETSQYIVGAFAIGYNRTITYDDVIEVPKIICISYKWEGESKVKNLRWDANMCDKAMLEKFIGVMDKADEIVAHNGDRFDEKWIRTRAIYHNIKMRPKYRSFDTLKKAKAHFRFPNNRLDTIAQYLGVGAKVRHEGLPMWQKCMQGDKKALKDMVRYCDGDIVVLEDVFHALQNYTKHNTHAGVLQGGFKHECPNCGGQHAVLVKNNVTAMGTIKRLMECDTCEYEYEISNSSYKFMKEWAEPLSQAG